jgi:hypothetical protein
MNIQERIDFINSLKLDTRVSYLREVVSFAKDFLNTKEEINKILGENILYCLNGIRSSRFIDSDVDMELLDLCLAIAKKLSNQKKIMLSILKDILYYSSDYPDRYNKLEIEKEIQQLSIK